jgi:hypothetical protein
MSECLFPGRCFKKILEISFSLKLFSKVTVFAQMAGGVAGVTDPQIFCISNYKLVLSY